MRALLKAALALLAAASCASAGEFSPVVVFQPSHQSDTDPVVNEALTASAIVDYAMAAPPHYREHKVWSYFQPGLHHATAGTNTLIAHTTALEEGRPSGYAWELARSNAIEPLFFISVHDNSGTGRHAVWGYVHDGDPREEANRSLAETLVEAIARATDLENRGVHLDSSADRNDYRCAVTGRRAFYSIDENVNKAPYRVILEIGDMERDRAFLLDEGNRRAIGEAIKAGLHRFVEKR